jgi:hypothetical protein
VVALASGQLRLCIYQPVLKSLEKGLHAPSLCVSRLAKLVLTDATSAEQQQLELARFLWVLAEHAIPFPRTEYAAWRLRDHLAPCLTDTVGVMEFTQVDGAGYQQVQVRGPATPCSLLSAVHSGYAELPQLSRCRGDQLPVFLCSPRTRPPGSPSRVHSTAYSALDQ